MQYLRLFFSAGPIASSFTVETHLLEHGLVRWTTTRRLTIFSKSFYGLPIGSFPTFKVPLTSMAKTLPKCLVSCLLTFQQCHFKLPVGPRSCWYPWKYACWFSPCLLRWSTPQLSPKPVTPSITNEDVTFPHSSHLNCPVPTVSPEELVLSRRICFELSAFASMVKVLTIVEVSRKENTSCSACGHLLQDLHHLFFDYLPLSLYANLSLAL